MSSLSRRDFARLVAASPLVLRGAAGAAPLPARPLGGIAFQTGILGFGAQRITDPETGQSTVDRIVAEGLDNGLNYIDTARGYGSSEERLGRALKGRRGKVFLVSKTRSATREEALKDLRESLRMLQTDYLDGALIHNISRPERFPDLERTLSDSGPLGALLEAKKQGMIRHIGVSAHNDMARVLRAFQTGHVELFMPILNFVERHTYNLEERVLPEARRRNIAIIAMKVLGGPVRGGGARLTSPEDYQATFRFVWGVPGVAVAIVGLRSPEELRPAMAAARAYQPLQPAELEALNRRGKLLAAQWGPLRGPAA